MATTARTKKSPRPVEPTPARPRRRWLLTAIVLLGLPTLLWFAPAIAGFAPILNRLIARATVDFRGTIQVGSASLGWLSPVVVRDLEVHDAEGRPLAIVPSVASSKSLLALITSPHDLGTFKLDGPQIEISLDERGSNLEDIIKPPPHDEDEKPPARIALAVVVTEGVLKLDDRRAGRQWIVDELGCEVAIPSDASQGLVASASGRVTPAEPAGRFSLHIKTQPPDASSAPRADADHSPQLIAGQGEFSLTSQSLPLEIIEPLLNRLAAGSELAGVLEANVTGHWSLDGTGVPRAEVNGQINATHLALVGPWLGEDRLRLDGVQIPCNIVRDGGRLEIRRCDVHTDFAQFACSGTIDDVDKLGPDALRSAWSALARTHGEVTGTIDLARLSRLLPATLHVRDQLQIEEGSINLNLRSGLVDGHWECAGHLETTRILATDGGRQIAWEHPLSISVAGHDTEQGPVIEQLNGQSDFLKFEGSGTPEFFGLQANFELARLTDELGQFLDLGELHVAGDGFGRLTWKRAPDDSFQADAELQATNFVLARPGKPAWNDPRLVVTAATSGRLAGRAMHRVDKATLQISSATDEFTASLASPVEPVDAGSVWHFESHLRGELARWVARSEPWSGAPPAWDISGQAEVVTNGRYAGQKLEIETCQADFAPLHAWGPNVFIDEPRLRIVATAELDAAARTLAIHDASLTSADLAGRLQNASFALGDQGGLKRLDHGEMQGNLATVSRWLQDPRVPATWQVTGLAAGTLQADLNDRAPMLDLSLTVEDLSAVGHGAQQPWRERQLRVTANATYDEAQDIVQLSRCAIESEAVQLSAAGRIEQWTKARQLSLAGKADYDLDKISQLLANVSGGEIRATGRESRTFAVSGPLSTALASAGPVARDQAIQQLAGKADFGWQSAALFGFDVGPGSLQAALERGVLQLVPARFNVSGGAVSLAPSISLAQSPPELRMPPGVLVDRVRVSPEMCKQWMMFVAPVMAGVTKVDGTFSVQLAGCHVPLGNAAAGEVAGQMIVHSLQVEPGPLVQELAAVLGAASAVNLAQQSQIDFKMVQGRIYHRGLELQFPQSTVRTYGSVGLDQTLAIMAELNVPVDWIRDATLRDELRKQVIQLPIGGTLAKPEIDRQKLAELRGQFLRDAAGGTLRNELQRQLNRILPSLEPKP